MARRPSLKFFKDACDPEYAEGDRCNRNECNLRTQIQNAINSTSAENGSDTPDFRENSEPLEIMPQENNTECTLGRGLSSHALLALAESKDDSQETIYCSEVFLLRKIAESSSDLVKGRHWEEFREAMGGMGCLEASHAAAVNAWEQWHFYSEG
jgi:hypothetical protein